jgi:hypothetical protein
MKVRLRTIQTVLVVLGLVITAGLDRPTAALALTAQGTSPDGTVDTLAPAVAIQVPTGGDTIQGAELDTLHFTVAEHSLDAVPPPITMRLLDGGIEIWSDTTTPEVSGLYEFVLTVPDVYTTQATLAVEVVDHFGAAGSAVTADFTILSSLSAAPTSEVPAANRLEANYPNPFNPSTTLRFALKQGAHVDLSVYDLAGRRIAILAAGEHPTGVHAAVWDGRDMAGRTQSSGLYLARLRIRGPAGEEVLMRRMTLLK